MKIMNLKLIIPVSKVYFCNILRLTGSKTPTTLTTKKQTNKSNKQNKQTKQTKQFLIKKEKGGGVGCRDFTVIANRITKTFILSGIV